MLQYGTDIYHSKYNIAFSTAHTLPAMTKENLIIGYTYGMKLKNEASFKAGTVLYWRA